MKLPFRSLIRVLDRLKYFRRTVEISCGSHAAVLRVHGPLEENLFRNHEEKELLIMLAKRLLPDDVVYDVGAHAGYHSVFLASHLEEGCVFAFEPNPNCFGYLKQNISLNPRLKIHAFELAVSDRVGRGKLSFGGAYDRSARLGSEEEWNVKEVATYSIDEFTRNHPSPTIVKIDVEGAENLVIAGALNSLKGDTLRALLLELHPTMLSGQGESASELRSSIRACGFVETFVQSRRDQVHVLFEKRSC